MKIKDVLNIIKPIVTVANPMIGLGITAIEGIFKTTTKRTNEMMNGKKSYIGIAITFTATLAQLLGYDVPVEATEGVTASLTTIFQAFGVFMASIGLVHKVSKATK